MLLNFILWALFGAAAGWIASKLTGSGGGLIRNVILGILGSFVGGFIADLVGISYSKGFSFVSLLVAAGGACLLILAVRLIRRK